MQTNLYLKRAIFFGKGRAAKFVAETQNRTQITTIVEGKKKTISAEPSWVSEARATKKEREFIADICFQHFKAIDDQVNLSYLMQGIVVGLDNSFQCTVAFEKFIKLSNVRYPLERPSECLFFTYPLGNLLYRDDVALDELLTHDNEDVRHLARQRFVIDQSKTIPDDE